jgi:hypothetical protein
VAAKLALAVPTPAVSVDTTPVFDTRLVIAVKLVPYPNPNIALSVPYPAAANASLAVPTPVTSLPTTPVLDTKLVIDTATKLPFAPYPKIAWPELPYPAAASPHLTVPTPAVSVATTPVFDTRFVTDTTTPPLASP